MSQSFIFDTTAGSQIRLGNLSGKGYEVGGTMLCIGVTQCAEAGKPGEVEVVQLWLSVPQMAELVKQFFWETISPGNIYTALLKRLLRRRWSIMSAPAALSNLPSYEEIRVE